ncbi:aminoglycoside phosphotransferase family protein [Viridibacillus sp. NPDC096237]|uniref:aminoglycoside phosphotransferase family protein n=1 Tax=Viridibacillus sp. NPDC096237 TaxID=3390721 RepID=UPI003D03B6EF
MLEIDMSQIPELSNFKEITKIHKGYSGDDKYIVQLNENDQLLLLKTFNLDLLESKKCEYMILQKMQNIGIKCSRPINIGSFQDKGYMITSYLDGNDAENHLLICSEEEQFAIGIEAGNQLKKMHQLQAPENIDSWYDRKLKKHRNYINAYLKSGITIENDEKIIQFIEENLYHMKNRPNLFQHDDFHPGNLIIQDNKLAGVIDFNRYDWGDPIHEFLKLGIFSREVSIPFSNGQIIGYFGDEEPDDHFWRLYSLYLAMCVFSSVVWTIKAVPEEIDSMLTKIYIFLEDHNYFSDIKPKWYSQL